MYICICLYMYINMYIYICICVYIYIWKLHVCIYIYQWSLPIVPPVDIISIMHICIYIYISNFTLLSLSHGCVYAAINPRFSIPAPLEFDRCPSMGAALTGESCRTQVMERARLRLWNLLFVCIIYICRIIKTHSAHIFTYVSHIHTYIPILVIYIYIYIYIYRYRYIYSIDINIGFKARLPSRIGIWLGEMHLMGNKGDIYIYIF